jgi:hypothetical protein
MQEGDLGEAACTLSIHYLLFSNLKVSNLVGGSYLEFILFEHTLGPVDDASSSYVLNGNFFAYTVGIT